MLDSDKLSECMDFMESHFPNWEIRLNTERRRFWHIIASFINADPILDLSVSFDMYSDRLHRFAYLSVILERFNRSFETREDRERYLNLFRDKFADYRYELLTEIRSKIDYVPKEITEQEERFCFFTKLRSSSLEAIIEIILDEKYGNILPFDHPELLSTSGLDFYINLIGSDESYRYEEDILNGFIFTASRHNHLYVLIDKNFDEDIITTRNNIYCIKEYKDCVVIKYHYKLAKSKRQIEFYSKKDKMDLPCPVIHLQPYKYLMIDEWKITNVFKSIFTEIPIPLEHAREVKDTILEYQTIEYKKGIPAVSFTNKGIKCPVLTGSGKGKGLISRKDFLELFYDDVLVELGIENESNHLITTFIERLFDIELKPDNCKRHIYPILNDIKNAKDS
jgi:hypothetical protein